ncbi:MAG: hypothetical protein ACKO9Z_05150 [Planctomycetota bacterium]
MPSRKPRSSQSTPQVAGFLGVGLDRTDETRRVTESEHFLLLGGSAETHEKMQDVAIRFDEKLKTKGKRLQDTCPQEALDILRDSMRS